MKHFFLSFLLVLLGVASVAAEQPRFTGAFLQLNAANGKAGQRYWEETFKGMNSLQMDTAIIQYVAYDQFYHYPTKIVGMVPAKEDVVMQILNAARDEKIKVFLGLQLDGDFWKQKFDLQERIERNIETINELHQRYGSHAGLGGWYLPEEIDDETRRKPYADDLLRYLGRLTARAHQISDHPVMISPFFGRNIDLLAYARWWDQKALPAIKVDIVAMQDGVGTHRTSIRDLPIVFSALSPVMKRHDVRFWANIESFDQTAGWPVNDKPFRSRPADFERILRQVDATSPSTTKTILFEYTQYMAPDVSPRAHTLFNAFRNRVLEQQETNPNDAKWKLWASGKTMLRGANIYQQEAYGDPWCSHAESSDFKALRAAGANYVNLSVPGVFNVDSPHKLNQSSMDELHRLVGLAKSHQLNVVIAFRTAPGRGEGDITESGNMSRNLFFDENAREPFVAMWTLVAQRMKTQEHVVGYDLLTEPTWKKSDSVDEDQFRPLWRSLATRTIAAIRSVDANTPILIEPDGWASPDALEDWKPLHAKEIEQQKKVVYAVHQYSPYEYTHKKQAFDPHTRQLTDVFRRLKSFQQTYNVPLAVNEFGIKFRRPSAAKFLEQEFKLLEELGVNHAIWIWEPADASCSGRHFDINSPKAKPVFDVVRTNWKANR